MAAKYVPRNKTRNSIIGETSRPAKRRTLYMPSPRDACPLERNRGGDIVNRGVPMTGTGILEINI
jgi:hypothetical protein